MGMGESADEEFLELLASDTDADFISAIRTLLESYPEPEVLRYILEALNEETDRDPDDLLIREEYRGPALFILKPFQMLLLPALPNSYMVAAGSSRQFPVT